MSASESVGARAVAGGAWLGATQAVRMGLTIVSAVVVARLLSPSDYGVAAMVAPVTGFLLIFQNLGLNQATVQARTLSPEQSNSMFWINVIASFAIAASLLLICPAVAWFYGDVRAAYYTAAMSATVVITGLALQHSALLSRELRFRAIAIIDMSSAVATLVVTVVVALLVRSYWALWAGAVAGALVQTVLTWGSSPWRPNLKISFKGTGKFVRFGGSLTGFNLLTFLGRNLDNVLIARLWGAEAVGLYDRGYRLMMYPLSNINFPLSRLMLPILSRLVDQPERYRAAYLQVVRAIMLVVVPGVAVAGATSEKLIPLLLGPNWNGVIPIFYWLSLTALIQPLSNPAGWLFTSSGRGGALLRWGVISTSFSLVAFVVGVKWGPVGVAMAYFISQAAKMPLLIYWCSRGNPVRQFDFYSIALPSYGAAAIVWVILSLATPSFSIWALLAVGLPASYLVAVALHACSAPGRALLVRGVNLAREQIRKRTS